MIKFALAFLLSILASSSLANPYDFKITRVVDGDTVRFSANFLPPELGQTLSLRIYGVDTPEKGSLAKCQQEADLSDKATAFTKQAIVNSSSRLIYIRDWDKYGGRVLGDLVLDGVSLRDMLIKSGLAREYYGGKKSSWCN